MFLCSAFSLLLAFFNLQVLAASRNPKRGLAFAESEATGPTDIYRANTSSSTLSWQYNWAQSPPDYMSRAGIPYIPMQWGSGGIENFASVVKAQDAKTIFGFNEPDLGWQSNINATYAAALWKQYIDPLSREGVRLGAPAISNSPDGPTWLSNFLAACSSCTIDFIPFHWYGTAARDFITYIGQMHAQFPDRPLWVTEFACTSMNDADVYNFLMQTTSYMDSVSWIEGYSWFAFFRKESNSAYNLLDINGALTPLGTSYIN